MLLPFAVALSYHAVHLLHAPLMQARLDDPAWRSVPAVSSFTQWSPRDGAAPSLRTELRVAYDERNLYVLVRAFDPSPDSIVRTVTRRDGTSASDEIGVYIDPSLDRRSGYEFYVNAAGVQRDVAISADSREDITWDAVWTAVARVDSAGWTAEFRIPFSQLRFPSTPRHEFGFLVSRVIQRRAEHVTWPAYHPSQPGIVSQFGVLDGIENVVGAPSIEAAPFLRATSRNAGAVAGGGDLRIRPASNVELNATVLPDCGQVEADPSVVNLTSVETFYPEHRPFFLDGAGTFRVPFDCMSYICSGDLLFYSRRIGRAPQLSNIYSGTSVEAAPIYGAAKLTATNNNELSFGLLGANTGRVKSANGQTLEPGTTYGMARGLWNSSDGQSGASLVTTLVDRSLDRWSDPYLVRFASVDGGTFRHRFASGQYEVWGSATMSSIAGSAPAIAAVQRTDVHDFQRPDAPRLDTTRTSLAGDQEELAVGKYGGAFNWEAAYERQSRGYETNDMGYLQRADQQTFEGWLGYTDRTPRGFYQTWAANLNEWETWNAAGTRLETAVNVNGHLTFTSNWQLNGGITFSGIGSPLCDHCARGGPALRTDLQFAPSIDIVGDPRRAIVPELYVPASVGDGGRSYSLYVEPSVSIRVLPQLQTSIGLVVGPNRNNTQWLGNFTDSAATHYAFARIDQTTVSETFRASYAATPSLSVETYVAPFVSKASYADIRELSATPLADGYADRFTAYTLPTGTAESFNVWQARATTVLRWEYASGSTLFAVWARDNSVGNTFTLKLSYWFNR